MARRQRADRGGAGVEGDGTDGAAGTTHLLVDGENLDATLGGSLLQRRPTPEDRPRWERAVDFARSVWGNPVNALFFINASSGHLPMPFLQALQARGLRPVLLSGPPDVKVVDVGIQRTLRALVDRPDDVMLGSHDGDFAPQIEALLESDRRLALLAFREYVSTLYAPLFERGLELFDLEDDARAFTYALPRLRVIDIDAFDPAVFL
jgi:putative heme uptake system protein